LYPGETPLLLTMVHDLYCVAALMKGAEPVHVAAQTHFTESGVCDLALAQLSWASGTVASLVASFMTPRGMPPDGFDRIEVFGQGWAARARPNPRPIELWDDAARWPMPLEIRGGENPSGMLAEELRTFCRVVRGTEPVPAGATYSDAIQVQRWLEQLQAASQRRGGGAQQIHVE
jgi:predicted dehydrogenase